MMRRFALAIGGALFALLLLAGPVSAQQYPPAATTPTTASGVGGTGATQGGALPRTGDSSTVPMVAAGVALVGLGAVAVVAARRRGTLGSTVSA
jgi:LPXTG-motif cell wall-anchored protein